MVYITYNISYEAFQAKHRPLTPNIIKTAPFFTHPYLFILTPNIPYISIDEKSRMRMKSMLKIKNFYNRSQTNGIYDLQYILRCISSQTSTSNSKYYWNRTFFHSSICIYPHTQYSIYLNWPKITYEDEIHAENQKLFKSLTDKLYIWLTIYLKMHFKPKIDL